MKYEEQPKGWCKWVKYRKCNKIICGFPSYFISLCFILFYFSLCMIDAHFSTKRKLRLTSSFAIYHKTKVEVTKNKTKLNKTIA